MRHLLNILRFETTADGDSAAGDAAVSDATANADTAADTSAEGAASDTAAVETPAAPDWLNTPEFQQAVEQQAAYAAEQQIGQLLAGLEGGQQEPMILDPFEQDPQQFTQGLTQIFGQMLDERLAPLMPIVENQQVEHAQEFVSGTIERLPEVSQVTELLPAPKEGEQDTRSNSAAQAIELAASGFLPAAEAQYGPGERAVEAALRAGASYVQETMKSVYDAGRASYKAELERIGSAIEEPGGTTGAAQLADAPKDEFEAARRFMQRQSAT